ARPNDPEIRYDIVRIVRSQWPKQTGYPCDFAQRRMPQRHSTRRDECRQIARCEIHPLRERSPLLAPSVDDSVRIMILCQKIIEQMSFARLAIGQAAQTGN